ncbi:Transcription factor IIIA [Dermatophagoides pteronyssinus]|uniref:Transcription factor IIIA n=1 Tax=Dermatophagoides pteronyssinus TaxID=6956 RepID=A0ABQ8JUD2_DERPT|nr:Transcription factor IIIA [Dermatophagoides pteronyssinus]
MILNGDIIVQNNSDNEIVNKIQRKGKKFNCPYEGCDACFGKNIRLQTHIRIRHTGYTPYECPHDDCQASFACQTYLNKHLRRHEKETTTKSFRNKCHKYSCIECPELLFRNKTQLKQHQANVHNQMPFKCEHCDQGFILRSKLNAHRHRHRGYKCARENCDYQTDRWSDLRKHLANEHRKLECNICMKSYSSLYNLRLHRQTVHPDESIGQIEPEFHCPHNDCNRSYTRLTSLQTHLRTNHCDPKHCCSYCDQKFRHKKSLQKHLDRLHSNNDNSDNDNVKPVAEKKTSKMKLTEAKLNKLLRIKSLFDDKQSIDIDCTENNDQIDDNDTIDYNILAESNIMADMMIEPINNNERRKSKRIKIKSIN